MKYWIDCLFRDLRNKINPRFILLKSNPFWFEKSLVNILAKNPYFFPPPKSWNPYFFCLLLSFFFLFFFFFFFFSRKVCNHPHQHHHFHLRFCWVLNFGVLDICFSSKYWVRGLIFCQKVGKGRLKGCVRYIFASLFLNPKESTREARKLFWFSR